MDTGDMKTKKKFHIDTTSLNFPKAGMEVSTYMRDGMITDWDMFEQVLDYSYKKIIQSQSEYHPVLFSEAPWNKQLFHNKQSFCNKQSFHIKQSFRNKQSFHH